MSIYQNKILDVFMSIVDIKFLDKIIPYKFVNYIYQNYTIIIIFKLVCLMGTNRWFSDFFYKYFRAIKIQYNMVKPKLFKPNLLMNQMIFQVCISFFSFNLLFLKYKLFLNQLTGHLKFGLTVLYCIITIYFHNEKYI